MHKVYKSEIIPGMSLTCVKTDKFKTGCLTISLVTGLNKKTAASYALLPRVLRRGTTGHPDMQSIAEALDELYGATIESHIRKKGELQCVGLYADFPDESYIPGGQSVLEDVIKLLGEMLLSPYMQDGCFLPDYVESEKVNLIDDINAAINDKRGYSIDRLLEEMCADEAYSINKLGGEAEAHAITPESLTALYHDLLASARTEVFYCGTSEPERVEKAIRAALSGMRECHGDNADCILSETPKTEIRLEAATDAPHRCVEKLDVSQGKLSIGFRIGASMKNPDYLALIVFNSLYGGSVTSKLFLNVREKLSLCYYVSSMIDKHKGVMIVASGIEESNYQTALDEILEQLTQVKNGEISEWEFESAKRYVINAIKSSLDRAAGLEELYLDSVLSAVPYDPATVCDSVKDVTMESIINIASGIKIDTIYFLTPAIDDTSNGASFE